MSRRAKRPPMHTPQWRAWLMGKHIDARDLLDSLVVKHENNPEVVSDLKKLKTLLDESWEETQERKKEDHG